MHQHVHLSPPVVRTARRLTVPSPTPIPISERKSEAHWIKIIKWVASAVLGFIAERTKLTPHDIDVDFNGECDYPANPAYLLALLAIPLLAVAMIIASLAGGCCGCCRPRHGASESKRIIGIVCAVFSWIAALIAGVIYANGVAWNLPVTRYDSTWCRLLRDGYLRLAAWLSLAATALAITSYSMLRARAAPAAATRSTAPAPAAAGTSGPKPDDGSYPPAAEAIAVPAETQWSAPPQTHGHGQRQWTLPEVPRHPSSLFNTQRAIHIVPNIS